MPFSSGVRNSLQNSASIVHGVLMYRADSLFLLVPIGLRDA